MRLEAEKSGGDEAKVPRFSDKEKGGILEQTIVRAAMIPFTGAPALSLVKGRSFSRAKKETFFEGLQREGSEIPFHTVDSKGLLRRSTSVESAFTTSRRKFLPVDLEGPSPHSYDTYDPSPLDNDKWLQCFS